MSFKAILWDFGGVLTSSPFDAFSRYEAERGLPADFIRSVNARNHHENAWAQFESSRCTLEEFDRLFLEESRAMGYPVPGRDVLDLLGGDLRPRMIDILKRLKRTYHVACLTNNMNLGQGRSMWGSAERAARVAEVMTIFHLVIESSLEGLRKPDPRIYQLACDRIGVAPAEIVYLDDLGVNLKPAREMGMTTIKVTGEAQAIADLSKALGLTL